MQRHVFTLDLLCIGLTFQQCPVEVHVLRTQTMPSSSARVHCMHIARVHTGPPVLNPPPELPMLQPTCDTIACSPRLAKFEGAN